MTKSTNLVQTLPASCYTSEEFLKLAKSEIFDKGWHFVVPLSRFTKSEKEKAVQFDFLKNPFFGLCDIEDIQNCTSINLYYGHKDEILEEEDVSVALSKLEKVNSIVSESGLVFITHEKSPSQTFEQYYGNQLTQFINPIDFRKMPLRRSLVYETDYNFLTFIDGYQECLHCKYTHPGLSKMYSIDFYKVEPYTNFCRHLATPSGTLAEDTAGLFLYFFPVSSLNLYGGGLGCFRVCPISADKCRMEFDYFFEGLDDEFEEYYHFVRQVAEEDRDLCEAVQINLKTGKYHQGILNPIKETGVIYYQNLIRQRTGLIENSVM
ncbi:uncharacterized protein PRCAT00002471001 [Priceomyces carsonii]|uniref:uncharacterized protein n=1 Tax=Priceomyces carsonii TaxID=28549 RepID=UPI002ED8CBE1|nr:unnamed protein product [Priceomyces carsonii]